MIGFIRNRVKQRSLESMIGGSRFYASLSIGKDLRKINPVILKRIENRGNDYPIQAMIPIARDVVQARSLLYHGVSKLLQRFPILTCKFCSEVYIGEKGHQIRTCGGFGNDRRSPKDKLHEWKKGGLNDLLLPVPTYHLPRMFQRVERRYDYDRVPAVMELCWQAGGYADDNIFSYDHSGFTVNEIESVGSFLSEFDLKWTGVETFKAWETMMSGLKKLLSVYPAKVCKRTKEVHVGSGHNAKLCGVMRDQSWRGTHYWRKAKIDDLFPKNLIWYPRPQDAPILQHEGRDYYGRVPAVLGLCMKAGLGVPSKDRIMMSMMKLEGKTVELSSLSNVPAG